MEDDLLDMNLIRYSEEELIVYGSEDKNRFPLLQIIAISGCNEVSVYLDVDEAQKLLIAIQKWVNTE